MRMNRHFHWLSVLIFILTAALLLAGCSSGGSGEEVTEEAADDTRTYEIYYTNLEGTALVAKSYTPENEKFEGILAEIIKQFQKAPSEDVASALPETVKINHVTTGVDSLTVDFDSGYLSLTNVQQVLLRAGIVKTLVQLPGVYRVSLTSDGQPLIDEDGSEMPAMNDETFIDSGGAGINSYHYVDLKLYFAERDGHLLGQEERSVFYSSNVITERVIAEQIVKGPSDQDLMAVTSPDVQILDVRTTDHICTIDLDSTFGQTYNEAVAPETVLYAFVNSICDSCGDIRGVRFQIEGESDIRFRGQVSLDQTFTRSSEYIDNGAEPQTEAVSESAEETEETDEKRNVETETETGTESTEETKAGEETSAETEIQADTSAQTDKAQGVGVDPALVEQATAAQDE